MSDLIAKRKTQELLLKFAANGILDFSQESKSMAISEIKNQPFFDVRPPEPELVTFRRPVKYTVK